MQQLNGKMRTSGRANSIKKGIKVLFPALTWVAGLVLAGSDGPWMPYINGMGGLMFLGASICLGRVLPGLENSPIVSQPHRRCKANRSPVTHLPGRVKSGYSGEFGLV